jgi:hypothetical protein
MELSESDGALLFAQVGLVISRLEDLEINCKPLSSPLPRGALSCGEACTLIPALFMLLADRFPSLADPEHLSELLQRIYTAGAGGKPH